MASVFAKLNFVEKINKLQTKKGEEVKEVLENPQDLEFEKECRKCQMAWPRGENHDVLREDSCQRSGGPAELLGNLGQRIKKIQQIRQKLLE